MEILNNNLIEIYHGVLNGGIVLTGNSLKVVGAKNNLNREFITIDENYTLDWNINGSKAYLEIPQNSIITYAVLEWFTTISNNMSKLDINLQYSPVKFKTPTQEVTISSSNEAQAKLDNNNIYSSKWTDVTSYVQNDKSGYYSLSAVPSVNPLSYLDDNDKTGWTLTVVYANENLPSREICIYCGMKAFNPLEDKQNKYVALNNIMVPNDLGKSYLTMAVCGGASNKLGGMSIYDNISKINNDNIAYKLGNYSSAINLDLKIKPIIPYDNLFSGIIMNTNTESQSYGNIDFRGTLGNKNNSSYNINNQKSFRGNRSQLDILSLDISDKILPNQRDIVVTQDQAKDSDFTLGLIYAVQIDKNVINIPNPTDGGPLLIINSFSEQNIANVKDLIKITVSIVNKGPVVASNVILFNKSTPNSRFLGNSFYLNGVNLFLDDFPYNGIKLGDILVNSAIIIEYSIYFYEAPFSNPVYLSNNIKYGYTDSNNSNRTDIIEFTSNQIVVLNNPLENIKLYVDRYDVMLKDMIMYTVIVENTGAIMANNIKIQELLPSELTYVGESLTVNGYNVSWDANSPIIIPCIYPSSKVIVTFKATIN